MNPWIEHVKQFRMKHPKMSYKECLINARKTYKPKKKEVKKGGKLEKKTVKKKVEKKVVEPVVVEPVVVEPVKKEKKKRTKKEKN